MKTIFLKLFFLTAAVLIFHGTGPAEAQSHKHGNAHGSAHGEHAKPIMIPAGPNAPSVSISVTKDAVGGWNVHIKTGNFKFAPEHASGKHIPGEGHAHIYVNDKKISRVYGPWFHLGSLPTDGANVKVTLNANDHRDLMVDGKFVAATKTVGKAAKSHMHN